MADIEVHGSLKNLSAAPDIAFQLQPNGLPWASVIAAHNGTPEAYRAVAKTRFVLVEGSMREYWYKGGIALENLVPRYENLDSAQAYVEQLEALKIATGNFKDQAEDWARFAGANYEEKGDYNVATNTPPLTADATIGQSSSDRLQRYLVTFGGPIAFAIKDMPVGTVIEPGYLVQHPNGQWMYDAKDSAALVRVITLEEKTARVDFEEHEFLASCTMDEGRNIVEMVYKNGLKFPIEQINKQSVVGMRDEDKLEFGRVQPLLKAYPYLDKGTIDDYQNLIEYVYKNGLRFPLVSRMQLSYELKQDMDSNKFKYVQHAFLESGTMDENGNLIRFVYKNGLSFPPPSEGEIVDTKFDDTYDYVQGADAADNTIWNQWIEPLVVFDGETHFYAGVGRNVQKTSGELWVGLKRGNGLIRRALAARVRTVGLVNGVDHKIYSDDHNAPSVLLDKRVGAAYPLMIFQAEHGGYPLRYAKLTSKNIDKWEFEWRNLGTGATYSQCFRNPANPDEILVSYRSDVSYAGHGDSRPTRWLYSSNNGDTWVDRVIFSKLGGSPYTTMKEKNDGSGINISAYTHPINGGEGGIYFYTMDWATGAIRNPANPTPVVVDFRTLFANPQTTPLNPIAGGSALRVYLATGTVKRRLYDVGRGTDKVLICFQTFPDALYNMNTFNLGKSWVVSVDLSDGTVTSPFEVGDTGMPCERPAGDNFYTGGMAVIDDRTVAYFDYRNQSMLDSGTDVTPSDGKTDGYIVELTEGFDGISLKTKFITSKQKLMRPYRAPGSDLLFYISGTYRTMNDFDTEMNFFKLKQ